MGDGADVSERVPSTIPKILQGVDGPVTLADYEISNTLPCDRCQYDLCGAAADGVCSECGWPVPLTLSRTIDPVAHAGRSMASPKAVGNGLIAVLAALLLVQLMELYWEAHFIWAVATSGDVLWAQVQQMGTVFGWALLIGGGLAAIGSWWIRPASASARSKSGRSVTIMLVGAFLMLVFGVVWWWLASQSQAFNTGPVLIRSGEVSDPNALRWLLWALPDVAIIVLLWGLRGVLAEVGRLSRDFRMGGSRRQRIYSLIAALVMQSLAWNAFRWMVTPADLVGPVPAWVGMELVPLALAGVTGLFVSVGLIYLAFNMWSVRDALVSPPPKLSSLLAAQAQEPSGEDDGLKD